MCSGPGTKRGYWPIAVRKVEPPIFPEDAFFLKQGIDFHQDTQASNETTYVNLDETPQIHCQGQLSCWLGAALVLSDRGVVLLQEWVRKAQQPERGTGPQVGCEQMWWGTEEPSTHGG